MTFNLNHKPTKKRQYQHRRQCFNTIISSNDLQIALLSSTIDRKLQNMIDKLGNFDI